MKVGRAPPSGTGENRGKTAQGQLATAGDDPRKRPATEDFSGAERERGRGERNSYVRAAMVRTPWGEASELRARKLHPGPGAERAAVARNQRERLFGAMIAVAAQKGYEATTVADLVRVSGVSRSDFYEHFENREDCALGALETILEFIKAALAASYDGEGAAIRGLIEMIVEQPATARFCLVEVYAAGPAAIEMLDQAIMPVEALFEQKLARQQGAAEVPAGMVRAIVGGLRKVIHTRLYRDEGPQLAELAEELSEWSLGYEPPAERLRSPRRTSSSRPQFDGYTVPQRIARASAAVIAEKGYRAMTTDDIAERAAISLSTFYAHFKDKEEATVATIELVGALMLATVVPPIRRAADWRAGVRELYGAMSSFLAAEPDFAALTITEVYTAGPRALAQRDRIIDSLQGMLAPGFAENPETPPIAAETIGGAVYALLQLQLQSGGAASLPEATPLATYLTLAPFVGAEVACEVANQVSAMPPPRRRESSAKDLG
jgi:AcrR family transcriptional regulator